MPASIRILSVCPDRPNTGTGALVGFKTGGLGLASEPDAAGFASCGNTVPDSSALGDDADPEGSLGDIPFADIAAGDVADVPIVIFGALFDDEKLIIENSKTLDTVIATGTVQAQTVADALIKRSLIPQSTISGSSPENPAV